MKYNSKSLTKDAGDLKLELQLKPQRMFPYEPRKASSKTWRSEANMKFAAGDLVCIFYETIDTGNGLNGGLYKIG